MQYEICQSSTGIGNCNEEGAEGREKLKNEIELGLEYLLQTIGSNERITLPPIKYKAGKVYGGEWKNGMKDGKGRLKEIGKRMFLLDGENQHMQMEIFTKGNGKMIKKMEKESMFSRLELNMKWENDKRHGKGVEKMPDGGKYEGEYFEGKIHGRGILNFADGSMYEGQFQQNELHGYGTFIWPDQRVYKGEFKNQKLDGKGEMIWPDGIQYTGEYEEGKKHGQGVFKWSDGRKYIGTWIQGRQHGVGICYQENKEVKVGEWNKGKRVKWFEVAEIDQLIKEQKIKKEDLQF